MQNKNDNQCFKWSVISFLLYRHLEPEFVEKIKKIKEDTELNLKVKQRLIENTYKTLQRRLEKLSEFDVKLITKKHNGIMIIS